MKRASSIPRPQQGPKLTPVTPPQNQNKKLVKELLGLLCMLCALLLLISLLSYDPRDPSINHAVRGAAKVHNWAGLFGAYLSAMLTDFFGFSSYVLVLFVCLVGYRLCIKAKEWPWWRWMSFLLLALCLGVAGSAWKLGVAAVRSGGLLGSLLYNLSIQYFSSIGSFVIWSFVFLLVLQMLFSFSWLQLIPNAIKSFSKALQEAEALDKKTKEGKQINGLSAGTSTLQINGTAFQRNNDSNGVLIQHRAETPTVQTGGVSPTPSKPSTPILLRALSRLSKLLQANPQAAGGKQKNNDHDIPPWLTDLEAGSGYDTGQSVNAQRASGGTGNASGSSKTSVPEVAVRNASYSATSVAGQSQDSMEQNSINAVAGTEPNLTDGVVIDEIYQEEPAKPVKPTRKSKLPSLNLLNNIENSSNSLSNAELEAKGNVLMTVLKDFSIQAELVRITPGPVVTSFEVRPAPGVKSSRISSLSDDLALGLKAVSVRIQAPIPGTDTVGIELPNERREIVNLKDLLASKSFTSSESPLTMALGKDSSGVPATADLARMPHLLVAGSTGTGKSVFLNTVLLSILYKSRPEEVKLLLIDPKRIEMAVYSDLPHLVHPLVTDMALAKNALDWAVMEMERRYTDIARLGVRNVQAYNEKLRLLGGRRPPELYDLQPMPYLVIIIDELADLMLTAGKDVETSIVRLAQLARAAGIHLIIATQRPSVDVVTGLIKANFPCRISFQVTSRHDSRTILDASGAETLLGRGDMLFKPAGGRFQRMHGAFVSDEDVVAVANHWRSQQTPEYMVDFAELGNGSDEAVFGGIGGNDRGEEQMYNEAVEFVRQQGKASISLIQRRFRIGFNKAARFIEQMEQDGIIGPAEGSKPRTVR